MVCSEKGWQAKSLYAIELNEEILQENNSARILPEPIGEHLLITLKLLKETNLQLRSRHKGTTSIVMFYGIYC